MKCLKKGKTGLEQMLFGEIMENCITTEFLERVAKKYHYPAWEMDTLRCLAAQINKCMAGEAQWNHRLFWEKPAEQEALILGLVRQKGSMPMAEVAMTLGKGVDDLQDEYLNRGALSESYMIEVLASEMLLESYAAYNQWVAENTIYHVERYVFLQDDMVRELPGMLKRLELPIACNEAFCMLPKKSVAFYALLTEDATVICRGICTDCGRENCPNHIGQEPVKTEWHFADMTDRPLPYGYAQIFGEKSAERI